ncbi:MAS protein, partial [Thryothorus ludovicianus]|nr:MAS protein [Thryothorus ludovicianus]
MDESNITFHPSEGTENISMHRNISTQERVWEILTPLWVIMIISFLGFCENGIVLWCLCFQIKRNPFTAYITHLSIADISLLLCTFILSIEYIAGFGFAYGFYYYVTTTLSIVFLLGYNTGLYLLTAISIERCLSIVYPIWYRCHRSQHQSAIVCAILWTLSFFMTVAEYLTCKDDSTKDQFDDGNHCQALLIFTWILTFMIFIPLMILSSLILVIRIHRNSLRPHSSKLYIIIVATVIVFLIFAMPMRLLYLLNYHHWSSLLSQQNHVTIVLSTVNSSINPLVYFFVGSSKKKRFKESLKVVLSRALTDGLRPRSQEVGMSLDIAETIF